VEKAELFEAFEVFDGIDHDDTVVIEEERTKHCELLDA